MPDSLGRLCLVLHGHLPYVLHHGTWPHGEVWLYEGAAETYLPLLELLDELAAMPVTVALTVGLTPVLLEQLADPHFKAGFADYLTERAGRARADRAEFEAAGDAALTALADRWERWYAGRAATFDRLGRDLPAAFAAHARAGRIEILTGAATHGYLPLLADDASIAAQVGVGIAVSRRHLGFTPTGLWLPECAYRPAAVGWTPPVLWGPPRSRAGIEAAVAAVGLTHVVVDTHTLTAASPVGVVEPGGGGVRATNDALLHWDRRRGWGSPLDPVAVAGYDDAPSGVVALARHPEVAEQVWSAVTGYPGADDYLEFHVKHGQHGLRYRRVTSHHAAADAKRPYDPAAVPGRVYEQAQHFCAVVRRTLADYRAQTGRAGMVVAPFDAELFGHWWFEGLAWLRDVLLTLGHDRTVDVVTTTAAVAAAPPDKLVRLPEGSWGEGGGHAVWLNDRTRWLWEVEHRAEDRFATLRATLPWQTGGPVRRAVQRAARELLLLQASDWPFVIHSDAAADYGIARFAGHATRFDRLCTAAADVAAGRDLTAVQQTEVAEADAHDTAFADVDPAWWGGE